MDHEIRRFEQIDSTNALLKKLAGEADNGLTLWADSQTAGRGRLDRKWVSAAGEGAWFSVLVKDERLSRDNAAGLVFVCALAAAGALRQLTGRTDIGIKWPNDIVLNGKKLAGILCECGLEGEKPVWCVCGVGINLTQERFDDSLPWAGSVKSETGIACAPRDVIEAFLAAFDRETERLLSQGTAPILKDIAGLSATLGKTVRAGDITGTAAGFLPDGSLRIQTAEGETVVHAGDVSVRGLYGYV